MTSEREKLKPCPFCGGKASFLVAPVGPFEKYPQVGCFNSECDVQPTADIFAPSFDDEARGRLIEIWNRRVSDE